MLGGVVGTAVCGCVNRKNRWMPRVLNRLEVPDHVLAESKAVEDRPVIGDRDVARVSGPIPPILLESAPAQVGLTFEGWVRNARGYGSSKAAKPLKFASAVPGIASPPSGPRGNEVSSDSWESLLTVFALYDPKIDWDLDPFYTA